MDKNYHINLLYQQREIQQFIESKPRGLLLYSFMSPQLSQISKEISWIGNFKPNQLKLMAGGSHTEGDPESSIRMGFDYAFVGPAETALIPFLNAFLGNKIFPEKGIYYAPELKNLDQSFPIHQHFKCLPPLEITRGCLWNCQFCQTACQKVIHRSFESISKYCCEAKSRNMHRRISFICPSAFEYGANYINHLNYDAIRNLLSFFKTMGTQFLEYGIFPSETRPNSFREDFLDLILRYCSNKKITIGAQSGSDRLLKLMKRGHKVEDVEFACKLTYQKKLRPLVDFIFGFPGETSSDRLESLNFIRHLSQEYNARAQVHFFLPLSGTPYADLIPVKLDYRSVDLLRKFQHAGITTNWWEKGRQLALQMITIRDKLKHINIEYEKIEL
jgi:B12-binding domain/radical SAM domain protein